MTTEPETLMVWRCPTCGIGEVTEPGDYPPGGPAICPHPSSHYECRSVVALSELHAERKLREDEERHADEFALVLSSMYESVPECHHVPEGADEVLERHRERRSSGEDG